MKTPFAFYRKFIIHSKKYSLRFHFFSYHNKTVLSVSEKLRKFSFTKISIGLQKFEKFEKIIEKFFEDFCERIHLISALKL